MHGHVILQSRDGSIFAISNRHVTAISNHQLWHVQHSIVMNVTWLHFDQSAKQLIYIVGHMTTLLEQTMLLQYMPMALCLPVCLSCAGIVSKWLDRSSNTSHYKEVQVFLKIGHQTLKKNGQHLYLQTQTILRWNWVGQCFFGQVLPLVWEHSICLIKFTWKRATVAW